MQLISSKITVYLEALYQCAHVGFGNNTLDKNAFLESNNDANVAHISNSVL